MENSSYGQVFVPTDGLPSITSRLIKSHQQPVGGLSRNGVSSIIKLYPEGISSIINHKSKDPVGGLSTNSIPSIINDNSKHPVGGLIPNGISSIIHDHSK